MKRRCGKLGDTIVRARVIYNPSAGREQVKRNLVDILQILEEAGYETSAFQTKPEPFSAKKEARRAALAGYDLIVAAGGDGTVSEVISGIAELENRPKVGIIPAGTTNDYAHALKIPRSDLLAAARIIAEGHEIPMDIGKANDTYFMNICAGGFLSDITYEVPTRLKTVFGYLAYLAKGAEKLPSVKPIHMRIEYEEGVFDGMASMYFVALTNTVGGFEPIDPNLLLGDGKFTLFIVKTANIFDILQILGSILRNGKHINHPNVLYTHTSYVKAEARDDQRLMINLDGEYGGDEPTTFINLQQHITIIGNISEFADPIESHEKQANFMKALEELSPDQIEDNSLPYDGI